MKFETFSFLLVMFLERRKKSHVKICAEFFSSWISCQIHEN